MNRLNFTWGTAAVSAAVITTHSQRMMLLKALIAITCYLVSVLAFAVTLQSGDIIVVQGSSSSTDPGGGQIIHIDPTTGIATRLTNTPIFPDYLTGVAIESRSSVVVTTLDPRDAPWGPRGVIVYDVETGFDQELSRDGFLTGYLSDIAREPSGDLIVADDLENRLVRVRRGDGVQTLLASVQGLDEVEVTPDGRIFVNGTHIVSDQGVNWVTGAIFEIDPNSGIPLLVFSPEAGDGIWSIAVSPAGDIFAVVVDREDFTIVEFRLIRISGDNFNDLSTILAQGPPSPYNSPFPYNNLEYDHTSATLVSAGDRRIYRFDISTGVAELVAFGWPMSGNFGNLTVYVPEDGDGKSNILWRNVATGENYFYQMNGATIQSAASINLVSDLNWMIFGNGDLDGDGKADIVWRNTATGANYYYLMNGATILSSGFINLVSDLNWTIVGNGDMNGDGKADILWRNIATGENYVYLMNGAMIESGASLNVVSDQNWKIVGNGDLNGDGKADILWRNAATGANYFYLMNGATILSGGYINLVSDLNWTIVGNNDMNGDGKADIVWRNMATGGNYYYQMDGPTIQSGGYINLVSDLNWTIVGNNDMNGDGKADILWRNKVTGENYLYLMNGATIESRASINTIADQNWQIFNAR